MSNNNVKHCEDCRHFCPTREVVQELDQLRYGTCKKVDRPEYRAESYNTLLLISPKFKPRIPGKDYASIVRTSDVCGPEGLMWESKEAFPSAAEQLGKLDAIRERHGI